MKIDTAEMQEALENFTPKLLELGELRLKEIYVRISAVRLKRGISWGEVAREARAAPWGLFSYTELLSLADITNYVQWLSKQEEL